MIRRILPDLADTPIYVVGQIGTPFEQSKANGWTSPRLDRMLRGHLAERWRGRGIGIIVNTELLEQSTPDWNLATVVTGLIFHEIAHAVADGWGLKNHLLPDDLEPDLVERTTELVKCRVAQDFWADDGGDISLAEFYGHDARWIRVCCHLAYRAQALEIYLPEIAIIGVRAEQSLPFRYAMALDDEEDASRWRTCPWRTSWKDHIRRGSRKPGKRIVSVSKRPGAFPGEVTVTHAHGGNCNVCC